MGHQDDELLLRHRQALLRRAYPESPRLRIVPGTMADGDGRWIARWDPQKMLLFSEDKNEFDMI